MAMAPPLGLSGLLIWQAERSQHGEDLSREGFVQLRASMSDSYRPVSLSRLRVRHRAQAHGARRNVCRRARHPPGARRQALLCSRRPRSPGTEELPAVTVPAGRTAPLSVASASNVVSGRKVLIHLVGPSPVIGPGTGGISRLRKPRMGQASARVMRARPFAGASTVVGQRGHQRGRPKLRVAMIASGVNYLPVPLSSRIIIPEDGSPVPTVLRAAERDLI
jgi:hypothetical protein